VCICVVLSGVGKGEGDAVSGWKDGGGAELFGMCI
jgi:hypothetical protein